MTDRPVKVLAHRGASRAERENTVAAFRRAKAMGADGAELDVRLTSDGELVVHHDPVLPDGRVIADLAAVDRPRHVPTLPEALDACAGMFVNVEIKNDPREPDFDPLDSIADRTMALLLDRGEPQRWLISAFRMETVDRCRALADAAKAPIRTAWLTLLAPEDVAAMLLGRRHEALHPWEGSLERRVVDECHAHGIEVNTWTCDDPARMRELIGWGIDGICTNVPDVAVNVIAELANRGR